MRVALAELERRTCFFGLRQLRPHLWFREGPRANVRVSVWLNVWLSVPVQMALEEGA